MFIFNYLENRGNFGPLKVVNSSSHPMLEFYQAAAVDAGLKFVDNINENFDEGIVEAKNSKKVNCTHG